MAEKSSAHFKNQNVGSYDVIKQS